MANYSQDVLAKVREYDRASAPLKTRVHALAKQLGVTSKEMIEALGHAGIVVKAASSTVNKNQLDAVLNYMLSTEEAADVAAKVSAPEESAPKKTASEGELAADGEVAAEDKSEAAPAPEAKPGKKTAKKSAKKATKKAEKTSPRKTSKRSAKRATKAVAQPASAEPTVTEQVTEQPAEPQVDKSSVDQPVEKDSKETKSAREITAAKSHEAIAAPKASEALEAPVRDAIAAPATDEVPQPRKSSTRRRRARRTVHRGAAAVAETVAPEATDTVVVDTDAEAPETVTPETELHDVEPPLVAKPESVAAEQARYAPIFLAPQSSASLTEPAGNDDETTNDDAEAAAEGTEGSEDEQQRQPRPRRRRGRGRGRRRVSVDELDMNDAEAADDAADALDQGDEDDDHDEPEISEPQAIRGSTRLEAQRRRRNERREESRRRHVLSEAEFLARRESVERTMVVRERRRHDHAGIVTEVGVLEDDLLVEHFVTSDTQTTQIGNIYLGRVQNVLPSMEAAFVDIGTDRNGVIYSGDLNWKLLGTRGRSRKIEHALKSGDQVLVQVTKDPIGHKGARLSMHISLAGRFLVYVPGGRSTGISRKLPEPERKRLKEILQEVTPEGSGTIIRTAAENVSKEAIAQDVKRLESLWKTISAEADEAKARKGAKPVTLYKEPDMLVKVVRDVFNEDFSRLVVEGDRPWNTVTDYVGDLAPELEPRLQRYFAKDHGGIDVFEHFRIDEQLAKALDRKVWLPSGGTLVIDRTEAMTVIDVNTGKFTGSGGNLEETVTRNNLEAAEEIVRQMRLRDLGGMIVVDFIDMVLPENQELVLRRLKEALGRDRTRHEVSEVTSLGLVQMTRKRLGTGLLETFSTPCSCCNGRGLIIHIDPVEQDNSDGHRHSGGQRRKKPNHDPQQHPAALAMHQHDGAQDSDAQANSEPGKEQPKTGKDTGDTSENRELTSDEIVAAAVDAVVVASESEEPRPPRRKRNRRSVKHSAAAEPAAERTNSDKATSEAVDNASGLDLAEVAAAAVAEAKEKDPDEPSDDRYVAHHPRRRRRVTRTTPARTEHASADSAAADKSVKKPVKNEAKAPADEEKPAAATSSSTASRRTRRAVRRVRKVATPVAEQVEVARAEEKADTQRGGRSYEEAVEEFENSPRRRRPTRGKSRSDRAPRREDFEPAHSQQPAEAVADTSSKDENQGADKADKPASHGRRRRRAVRRVSAKSSAKSYAHGSQNSSRKQSQSPKPESSNSKEDVDHGADAREGSGARKRSGRRRGVRRAVRRG